MSNTPKSAPPATALDGTGSPDGCGADPALDDERPTLADRLIVWPQYALPQHALSRLILAATRIRTPLLRNAMIKGFMRKFEIDMSEAAQPDPLAYESFNAFFTRSLHSGARPIESHEHSLCCPADGSVSQLGRIDEGTLLQAKGKTYEVADLLGGDAALAEVFARGNFITVYLAPANYHRVHMPASGTLRSMHHVPGRLFSVNDRTASVVPRLFARNERTVSIFDCAEGAMALVLVGAFFVGCIEHVWSGVVTPASARNRETRSGSAATSCGNTGHDKISLAAGLEMGRFNMGSTVIVLHENAALRFDPRLRPGASVKMGERITCP